MATERDLKRDLNRFARIAYEQGLVWGKSGNISVRLDDDSFLISASGASLGDLGDSEIVECSVSRDKWRGSKNPSIETGMHRAIYHARIDANGILHSQPFYTTLLACSSIPIDTSLFPEAMAYLGRIERVAYHHPGSRELAQEVASKSGDCDVLLLDNHGGVCIGKSLGEAILKTETLEFLSRLLVYAKMGDIPLNSLSHRVAGDFTRHLKKIGGK